VPAVLFKVLILTNYTVVGTALPFFTLPQHKQTVIWCLIHCSTKAFTQHEDLIMNIFTKAVLAIVLLSASSLALAQGTDGTMKRGGHQSRGMQGMPVVERMMRALKQLDMSDEQRDNIQAVFTQMKADIRPNMQQARSGQEQLKTLIQADVYDETAVADLAALEGELATERMLIASRALSTVYGFLTVEQRDELSEQRKQRRHGHRDRQHSEQHKRMTEAEQG